VGSITSRLVAVVAVRAGGLSGAREPSEIAAIGDLPLVGGGVGEGRDDFVRRSTSRLSRSSGLVNQILAPVRFGEIGECGDLLVASRSIAATSGSFGSSIAATSST
jgi:hypothetical protein